MLSTKSSISVLVAGDFAPRYRLAETIDTGDYSSVFNGEIIDVIRSASVSLVNFESPVADPQVGGGKTDI